MNRSELLFKVNGINPEKLTILWLLSADCFAGYNVITNQFPCCKP